MLEEFSGSYYLGRMYVTPSGEDQARLHSQLHERLNRELYATGEGVERLDAPLVMKLGPTHFPVLGGEEVPSETLAVPEAILEEGRVDDVPALREVLVAKKGYARQLLWLSGGYEAPDAT